MWNLHTQPNRKPQVPLLTISVHPQTCAQPWQAIMHTACELMAPSCHQLADPLQEQQSCMSAAPGCVAAQVPTMLLGQQSDGWQPDVLLL